MNGIRRAASLATIAALCLILGNELSAKSQPRAGAQEQQGAPGKQPYTMAEYNAYQACAAEKAPAMMVKCLDDFVSKYPNSALLVYGDQLYIKGYGELKNYAKVIEYADKLAALGDKISLGERFNAYYTHAAAYNGLISSDKAAAVDPAIAKAAQAAASSGLQTLAQVKKPDNVSEDAWKDQTQKFQIFLDQVGAQAATVQKDYAGAIQFYKAVLALTPDDGVTSYRLGLAYMAMTPPQAMDGFWAIARAVTAKGATQSQANKVKDYLRKLIQNYQQAACDSLTDAELNELLQLASSSPERPASYKIASADDLTAARKDMTIASVIADLKAGGDKGKVTWLAACGLEFPGVPGKVIENDPGTDSIELKIAFVTSDAEFQAATTPNMDVKVVGQPEVERVEKDSAVHFTGTLVSYDPDPAFMLHWDKAKVNEEDIPKEKEKKPAPRRRPTKKPGRHS